MALVVGEWTLGKVIERDEPSVGACDCTFYERLQKLLATGHVSSLGIPPYDIVGMLFYQLYP